MKIIREFIESIILNANADFPDRYKDYYDIIDKFVNSEATKEEIDILIVVATSHFTREAK